MNATYNLCSLVVNGSEVEFNHNVYNVLEFDNLMVVHLLDVGEDKSVQMSGQPVNNVYAVDFEGKVLWNIKDKIGEDALYVLIKKESSDLLKVTNFKGFKKTINVVTGELFNVGYTK